MSQVNIGQGRASQLPNILDLQQIQEKKILDLATKMEKAAHDFMVARAESNPFETPEYSTDNIGGLSLYKSYAEKLVKVLSVANPDFDIKTRKNNHNSYYRISIKPKVGADVD